MIQRGSLCCDMIRAPLIREPVSSGLSKQLRCGSQETRHQPSWSPSHNIAQLHLLKVLCTVQMYVAIQNVHIDLQYYWTQLELVQHWVTVHNVFYSTTMRWVSCSSIHCSCCTTLHYTIQGLLWHRRLSPRLGCFLSLAFPGRPRKDVAPIKKNSHPLFSCKSRDQT